MKTKIMVAICIVALATSLSAFANSVGRTQGTYATSPTGAATYSIPIWAPPGPHGVQPHIALTYNSQQGNGYVGVGWALSGLSSIYRCNLTIAQDGAAAPVGLATSDGYCMDGRRLRLTGGTYGTAGSTYQTEVANFTNVEAYGAAGNGPSYWQATDRNGWHYTYGAGGTTSNAQVLASGSTTASSWQLNEVQDPNGNTMKITYEASDVAGLVVPNVISWVPTSAGSSSYNYTMTFSYGTTGSVHGYVGGTPFNNTNILSSIAIAYQGTAVKTYYLTYSNTTTATSRYLLTQVQECAGTGTSNCLSPTSVGWQPGAAGLGTGTALGGTVGSVFSTAFDLNGDGRNDLVMFSSSNTVLVAFGGATGYGTPIPTGLSSAGVSVGDVDGSGVDGLLVDVSGTWYYYKWNQSSLSFVGTSTGISVATAASPVLADLDGDGRADFAYTDSTGIVHVRLSTSAPGAVSFSTDINTEVGISGFSIRAQIGGSNRALHFWGSSQADLLGTERTCAAYNAKGICTAYQYIYDTLHFTGSTFSTAGLFPTALSSPNPAVDFADYNDDGCTDILTATQLLLSACNGTAPISVALPTGVTAVGGMDWNGDGRRDVLVSQSSGTLGVVLSTGTGLSSTVINTSYATGLYYYAAPNLIGDGQDGLVATNNTFTSVTYYLHQGPGAPPDLATSITDGYGNFAKPTYVSIASSNYGQWFSATYPYMSYIGSMYVVNEAVFSDASNTGSTWNQQFWYAEAEYNLQGRGFAGFAAMQTYDSRTTLWDTKDRDLVFPYTGMVTYEILAQTNLNTEPVRTYSATPQSLTLSGTTNQERFFPYVYSSTGQRYEVGGAESGDLITTTAMSYTYDSYGNATTVVKTVTDSDPGSPYTNKTWTTTTTNTTDISQNPSGDLAAWCLTMLDETQVTYTSSLAGSAAVTRTKTFTPDVPSACRIKTIVTEPTANGGAYKVTENLIFDSFGNIQTDTVTGANMGSSPASRETQYNWGTTGQFLTSAIDPSGAASSWTYTSSQALTFGVPDAQTDANALTTSWGYDAFGRKTSEKRPDGTSTVWAWSLCTSYCGFSNSVYQVGKTSYQVNGTSVIDYSTTLYDPVDRVTETQVPNLSFTVTTVQTDYDSLGRVTAKSMPFVSGATRYWQGFGYDIVNRLVSTDRPISSTNSTSQSIDFLYAGRTTNILDPYGRTSRVTVTDVNGWLRKTSDALGYAVTRAYDAAGSVIGVTDSAGNTLMSNFVYNYGLKPYLVSGVDIDRGAFTNTYDSLGERTAWTDAKGNSFSMTYDALSRPLTRTEPDLFTEWNYGTAAPAIGKLVGECTADSSTTNACNTGSWLDSEARTYDSLGRPQTRSIIQNGNPGNDTGGAYTYTWTYDPTTGYVDTLTYPKSTSGFALELQYNFTYTMLRWINDVSDPQSTCGTTCTLWDAITNNGFGEITQETFGNGVTANRTYDAVTSWLGQSLAGVGGGSAILNQSYLYDENGNVIQRQDNNLGITESFAYDYDYRLTCAALSSSCSTPTFVYDGGSAGPGNITSQIGVGTYTYPAAGQPRPHAVTGVTGTFNGITNPTFSYDNNGNMLTRGNSSQQISWFSYNYPASISATDPAGSEGVAFQYGPNRQRWKQIYQGPSGTEQTYYVGKKFEVVSNGSTTTYRHYIYAGSKPVAIYSRTSAGTNTMSYLLGDHQGSVSAIASNAGAVDVTDSFSAFGQLRDSGTWSGAPTSTEINALSTLTRQGYTFQTWLGQSMGLNHMNGRVEDAILGRMMSADPHITDPTNAQSYNRYSYVRNNPLSRIDPTGFEDETVGGGDGDIYSDGGGGAGFDPGPIDPGPIDPGPTPTANIPSSPPTLTGSLIAGQGSSELYIIGGGGGSSSSGSQTSGPTGNNGVGQVSSTDNSDSGTVSAAQSQSGSTTVTGSGFGGTFSDGTTIDGDSEIIATGNSGGSTGGVGSTVSGWAGLGLSAVETINPAYARGYGFYWKPWANQYGAARSLGKLAHAGGWLTLGAATFFDLWDYADGGPDAPSLTQVGTNAAVGTAGMLGGPLTALPAAQYFLFQQLYNNFYPGGSTQAFSDLGGYLGDISATGLGP